MARPGVGFEDIASAADALLIGGERPTTERIRLQLGRGSPNTIGPLLDRWWAALGPRLLQQQAKLALPDAPEEVATAASQFWELALATAHGEAKSTLAAENERLLQDRAVLSEERERDAQERAAAQQAVSAANQALAVSEARLAELQQRAAHQAEQTRDLTQQRDALQARIERQEADLTALTERLQEQEVAATAARATEAAHRIAMEDRAHAEVDRARQEIKELRSQLTALARERTANEQLLRQQRDEAVASATSAQREAGQQRGRAEALEQQLARLGDLPVVLQATLAKVQSGPKRRAVQSAETKPRITPRKPRGTQTPLK